MELMFRRSFFILCFVTVSVGCSNIKSYPNNLTKNIFIKTKTESGSFFSSVKARVDIFDVDKKCQAKYIGTVDLDEKKKKVGLAKNKISYLDFRFLSSGFLSSSSSSTSMSTLLKARKGYIYDVLVSYVDDLYNVEIWEKRSKRSKGRELDTIPLNECRQL